MFIWKNIFFKFKYYVQIAVVFAVLYVWTHPHKFNLLRFYFLQDCAALNI